jgi:hypothetical protein
MSLLVGRSGGEQAGGWMADAMMGTSPEATTCIGSIREVR